MIFPAELWHGVIGQLPTADQRTCLSVSRMHHDIAMTFLFSHVHITLGAWCESLRSFASTEVLGDTVDEDLEHTYLRTARITSQIIQYIVQEPAFASKIRRLSVRAYAVDEWTELGKFALL